jgi:uncharacterized protein
MKILVTGSTGLVGSALIPELQRAGHTVCRLIRPGHATKAASLPGGFDVTWDPATGELGGAAVGADAVVNLAGAPIAEARWTSQRKHLLRASRVETTRALVNALARMAARPRVLISASAIGFYGDRSDEVLRESSAPGTGSLSEIACEWEAEALKADALGIRVVLPRFGIILAKQGGAFPTMAGPFRFGLGGKLGSGQQWMSWIMLEDVLAVLRLALENGALRGAVNVVSPQPVRNATFAEALAKTLRRPALFSVPAFALRLTLGEMADAMVLASQRVVPERLEQLRYPFRYPDLPAALSTLL